MMKQHDARTHTLPDGTKSFVYSWLPRGEVRGVVQIVHGMAEHAGRYQRLADALTQAGFAVYAQDLPGHGRTVDSPAQLGHVDDPQPFAAMLRAVNAVRGEIEHLHPRLPYVLLGHSLGSFLVQHVLVEHGRGLTAAVLSGSSGNLGPLRGVGVAISALQQRVLGAAHRSALTERLSFGAFNRHFAPNRTAADWLSRDEAEVDAYVQSPLCGFRCSASLWADLLRHGKALVAAPRLARIPKGLPVLLLSGSEDPAALFEKGPSVLHHAYLNAGLRSTLKLYPGARHEVFNETHRDRVTQDLLSWLDSTITETAA